MQSEFITLLAALVLTPIISVVITIPLLFSKTYVQTLIQPSFSFDKALFKEYSKRTGVGAIALAIYWSILIIAGQFAGLEITNTTTQTIVSLAGIPLLCVVGVITSYPQAVQERVVGESEFSPSERKHQIILGFITTMKSIVLFVVFFGLIVFL